MYTRAREPSFSVIMGKRFKKWFKTCSPSSADSSEMPSRISADGVQAACVTVEVMRCHRIAFGIGLSLYTRRLHFCLGDRCLCGSRASESGSFSRMLEVNGYGIAVDSVLLLLFAGKLPLPGVCLSLRDFRCSRRRVGAIAIDRRPLRGGHWRCAGRLRSWESLRLLKLLHRGSYFLLLLPLLRVMLCLQLLLRLETRYLLGVRRGGAHRDRAGWRGLFVSAQQARNVGKADETGDDDQRNNRRHTLFERRLRFRLLWNGRASER